MPPHRADIDGTYYISVSTNIHDTDTHDMKYSHVFENGQGIDDGCTYVVDIYTGGVINCRYCLSFPSPMSASSREDNIQCLTLGH